MIAKKTKEYHLWRLESSIAAVMMPCWTFIMPGRTFKFWMFTCDLEKWKNDPFVGYCNRILDIWMKPPTFSNSFILSSIIEKQYTKLKSLNPTQISEPTHRHFIYRTSAGQQIINCKIITFLTHCRLINLSSSCSFNFLCVRCDWLQLHGILYSFKFTKTQKNTSKSTKGLSTFHRIDCCLSIMKLKRNN